MLRPPPMLPLTGLFVLAVVPAAAQPSMSPFTLSDALARAHAHAPLVRAAQARAGAAERAVEAAGRWRAPTLDLSVENLGPQQLEHDGFVWLTQPLDVGPRRSARLRLARAQDDVLQRDVAVQRRTLDAEVVETYMTVAARRQSLEALEAHGRALGDLVEYVRLRVARGVAAEGDLRKLEAEQARASTARLRTSLDMRQHVLTLSVLTQEPAGGLAERVVIPPLPPLPSAADVTAVRDRRADVAAAVAQLEERRAAAAAERALGGTALSAMGGYKRTAGFHTATAGVSIDLPLGIRNAPARLRAEADVTAAALELERTGALAIAEMTAAIETAQALASHARQAETALVAPAADAVRAARAAFREGTGDVMALVDAERVHLETRRDAQALQVDAVTAALRARLALGEAPLP